MANLGTLTLAPAGEVLVVTATGKHPPLPLNTGTVTIATTPDPIAIDMQLGNRGTFTIAPAGDVLDVDDFSRYIIITNIGELTLAPEGVLLGDGAFPIVFRAGGGSQGCLSIAGVPIVGQLWPRGGPGNYARFNDYSCVGAGFPPCGDPVDP